LLCPGAGEGLQRPGAQAAATARGAGQTASSSPGSIPLLLTRAPGGCGALQASRLGPGAAVGGRRGCPLGGARGALADWRMATPRAISACACLRLQPPCSQVSGVRTAHVAAPVGCASGCLRDRSRPGAAREIAPARRWQHPPDRNPQRSTQRLASVCRPNHESTLAHTCTVRGCPLHAWLRPTRRRWLVPASERLPSTQIGMCMLLALQFSVTRLQVVASGQDQGNRFDRVVCCAS